VVEPGQPGLAEVLRRFGAGVLAPNGGLDRRALRELIFSDSSKRRDLERILHPLIRAEMERQAQAARGPYLVMAIPLLVESGLRDRVDRVLVVDAGEAAQVARLMARDGGSEEQARSILAAQASRTARLQAADDVLDNRGSEADLRVAVDALHQRFLGLATVAAH
jgi:dephospho-CoA kinase